jgi:hypothetical protein
MKIAQKYIAKILINFNKKFKNLIYVLNNKIIILINIEIIRMRLRVNLIKSI